MVFMMLCLTASKIRSCLRFNKQNRSNRGGASLNHLRFRLNKNEAGLDFLEPLPESRSSTSTDDELIGLTLYFHHHAVIEIGFYFLNEMGIDNVAPIDPVKDLWVEHGFEL